MRQKDLKAKCCVWFPTVDIWSILYVTVSLGSWEPIHLRS